MFPEYITACGLIGPASLPVSAFQSPFIAPKKLPLDIAFCVLSLVVDMLVTALLVCRLRRVSAPARDIQSVSDLVFGLAICFIETGALLAVAQLALLVFLVLEHPFLLVIESFAAQIYVSPVPSDFHPLLPPPSSCRCLLYCDTFSAR